jgi:signal transduction histidine kinase
MHEANGRQEAAMLSAFVTTNRSELIELCRERVADRSAPEPRHADLAHGIPLFLDELASALRSKRIHGGGIGPSASKHGSDLLHHGFTVSQVVRSYGDVCQTLTALAIERKFTITTEDFRVLNFCLDEAIADAVTEYERQNEIAIVAAGVERASKRETADLGERAHELRNMLGTATLAYEALRDGRVGIAGSTGALLGRSLMNLRNHIDRSIADVRLNAGIKTFEPIVIGDLLAEIELTTILEAQVRGLRVTVETRNGDAVVEGDREILASVIANLLQNAYKYTAPHSHVILRTSATPAHVTIEVEDECGGLPPGALETIFKPFEQLGADRSGLGLGLVICVRGVAALKGTIHVRDLARKGCVFSVELPRLQTS